MADAHDPHGHHGPTFQTYMGIFGLLVICTLASFVVNQAMGQNMSSAIIITLVGVVKALLVALIFMHLKWDWRKLYFLIVPSFILAVMMMVVLLPDIVLAWHQ